MATFTPVPLYTPSLERAALITDVADGDKIDLTEVLRRPANKLQFVLTDAADTVTYKVNHLKKLRVRDSESISLTNTEKTFGVRNTEVVEFWQPNSNEFLATGALVVDTAIDLRISSIEITGLNLSTGSTISIQAT